MLRQRRSQLLDERGLLLQLTIELRDASPLFAKAPNQRSFALVGFEQLLRSTGKQRFELRRVSALLGVESHQVVAIESLHCAFVLARTRACARFRSRTRDFVNVT